jgi:hypothetical protein
VDEGLDRTRDYFVAELSKDGATND